MLRSLFVILIFVPGFVAALRNRFAALVLYLWFALFRPQDWLWIDITSLRLSLILGVVLLVPSLATGLFPNVTHLLSVGMVFFVSSCLIAQIGAVRPDIGWQWIDFMVRLILTCMLLITMVWSERRLVIVLGVIAGSMGYHAAKAGLMWLLAGGASRFADGLAGAFVDNNGYALGTVMIMPLLLATAQNVGVVYKGPLLPWIRRGLYLSVPLCAFTVFGTYSRGGFVALAAATLAYICLQRRRSAALAGLVAVLAIALLVVPIPQSYVDRLQTISQKDEAGDDSSSSRPHFWRVGLLMGMSRPFGIGLRQYEAAYDQYDFSHGRFGHRRAVHNSHVEVFAELGFFGALIWTALFAYAFFVCLRVRARSRHDSLSPEGRRFLFTVSNGLLTSMAGFLVGGAFLSLALNDITWLTFALIAALDRVSAQMCAQPAIAPAAPRVEAPLAFRAVDSFAAMKGGRA